MTLQVTKLLTATTILAGGLILGLGQLVPSSASAQPPDPPRGGGGAQPPDRSRGDRGDRGDGRDGRQPPGRDRGDNRDARPRTDSGYERPGSTQPRRDSGLAGPGPNAPRGQWEYRFVDLRNDHRDEFENAIRRNGNDGWEYCNSERLRTDNGATQIVLVFKRHVGNVVPGGIGFPGPGGPGGGRGTGPGGPPGRPDLPPGGGPSVLRPVQNPGESVRPLGNTPRGGSNTPIVTAGGGSAGGLVARPAGGAIQVVVLKHANASDIAQVLQKVFNREVSATPDERTNSVVVRGEQGTLVEAVMLIERLDIAVAGPSKK